MSETKRKCGDCRRRELTYATVCSGIECMSAAAIGLPLRPVFFSEIEPFPSAVLKHRYPTVPNLGDMSKIEVNEKGEITNGITTLPIPAGGLDILAGGTPCQDVSNAGKRRGMQEGSGTRSSLAFEFVRLVRALRPRYVLWENVAGVLSDPSFPKFLAALADCGYGVSYRTLDAQFVRCADIDLPDGGVVRLGRAVPQRRRRVWAVGCAGGDVRKASEVLFEPRCVCGDHPPRRVTGQGIAEVARGRACLPDGVVGRASAIASNVIGRSDRCGGNGLGAKDEVAYTLDTVQPQGVAVSVATKQQSMTATVECGATLEASCYKEPQSVVVASGFNPSEPGGVESLNQGLAGTFINGSCPGRHSGVVEMHGVSFDGGFGFPVEKESISGTLHNNTCPGHCNGVILTNSNGEDVMPTIRASEYKQVDSQKDTGGGYVIERRVPLATHNFECYDNAQGVSVTLGARRSGDTLEIEAPLGFKCKPSGKARSLGEGKEVSPCLSASSCDASVAFGINANGVTKTAQMPCRKECAETLAVGHQGGVAISGSVSFEPGLAKREGEGHRFSDEVVSTLRAHMGDNLPAVAAMRYVVRRLTPTECERLMGLPDGWTLPAFATDEITDALVDEFRGIHDTFGAVMAGYAGNPPPKPKTAAWTRKWLERIADPVTCPDAPRYKACGNGWATNQPRWILLRVLAKEGIDPWNSEP